MKPNRSEEPRFSVFIPNDQERVTIFDDDFGWDAALRIYGDFGTLAEKHAFGMAIVNVLNKHEGEIPTRDSFAAETGAEHGKT